MLSTVRPRERTRREHGGRKFRAVVTRQIAKRAIGSNHPRCARAVSNTREVRQTLTTYNPFYFMVRYFHSFTPVFLPLFLYSTFSIGGSCTSYRASYTISAIDCPDTPKGKTARKSAKGSPLSCRLAVFRPSGECKSASRKGRYSLSAQLRLLLLLVGVEFVFPERSKTRAVGGRVPTARYPILFRGKEIGPVTSSRVSYVSTPR